MPRKSELPPGAVARMMANKKIAFKKNGKTFFHADAHEVSAALAQLEIEDGGDAEVTLKAVMAKMDYSRFDEMVLVPDTSADFDNVVYNAKLSNLIGCTNYALCDGGANGCIRGQNDMRLIKYNDDNRRVNSGIVSDNQIAGARLGTFCLIVTTNLGLLKLIMSSS